MNSSFGSLLAQVIPVILLALLIELREILRASAAESEQLQSKRGTFAKDTSEGLARYEEAKREKVARPTARAFHSRLGPVDALGFVLIYGLIMLLLVRAEVASLALADTGRIGDGDLAFTKGTVVLALLMMIVAAGGLELYRHFGGRYWPAWLFRMYFLAGFAAVTILLGSLAPFLPWLSSGQ